MLSEVSDGDALLAQPDENDAQGLELTLKRQDPMFSFEASVLGQAPTFVPLSHRGLGGKLTEAGSLSGRSLTPENLMRILAKNFSARTLTLEVISVIIIAVSIAGVSRHSLLLGLSALAATLFWVVADPLTTHDSAGPQPTAEKVDDSAINGRVFNPSKTALATPGSRALIASKV